VAGFALGLLFVLAIITLIVLAGVAFGIGALFLFGVTNTGERRYAEWRKFLAVVLPVAIAAAVFAFYFMSLIARD